MKRCKQCSDIKNEAAFRGYGNRKGIYKVCLACERVNNRFKYLTKKDTLTVAEEVELRQIKQLYSLLEERGLHTPTTKDGDLMGYLNAEITRHRTELDRIPADVPASVPTDLLSWLTADISDLSEEALEALSADLLDMYRPQTGVDQDFAPVYDDTYRDVLNKILKRFDDEVDGRE